MFYQYTGRGAEAETSLRTALHTDPNPQITLMLAEYYISRNRPAEAIPLLERVNADKKVGTTATLRLAAIAEAQGRPDDAQRIIDQALAAAPTSASVLVAKADMLRRQHKLDDAMKTVDLAIAAEPRSATAAFVRGQVLNAKGQSAQAEKSFEEVLRLNPRAAVAQVELARLHLRANAPDTVTRATKAVQADPSSLDARLTLARAQMQQHDFPAAQATLEELTRAVPGAAAPQAQLGTLLLMNNDAAGARAAFGRAITIDPFQLEGLAGLTTLDVGTQHQSEAIARLTALVDRAPQNTGLLLLTAGAYSAARDLPHAETLLLKAIEIDPGLLAAYSLLGRLYVTENRLDAARVQFERVARQHERPVVALTILGIIDQMQNRIPDAQQAFERAMKSDPRAGVAANNLAWIYAENGGSLDRALELAETANASLPNNAEVSDTLGWVYYKKGLVSLAITTLRRSLELDPKNVPASYHLALAYETSGNRTEARRMFDRYLTLDPSSERSAEVRRRLQGLGTQG
ncbi:MAG: tetratricopeptide repeat protein [Vicinamibacterales bacterium]